MNFSGKQILRYAKKGAKRIIPLAAALYFVPKITVVFFLIGLIDVSRNRPMSLRLLEQYFFGNGVLTWLIAPFNLLIDLISLPFRNRGIYRLEDLPADYKTEVEYIISTLQKNPELLERLGEKAQNEDRTMVFFKWYGKNFDSQFEIPALQKDFKYVKTIGISVFNKSSSTGLHFGPFRTTIRVLYNLNPIKSEEVFIEVGETINRWKDSPLFIFDDTLRHRSVNESEELRFCMFVDILRPSYVGGLLSAIVSSTRIVFSRVNFLFYKNWKFLR